MTFGRAVLIGAVAWVSLITGLHAALNWGVFDSPPAGRESRAPFRVGYLPVT